MMRARTYALFLFLVSTAVPAACGGGPRPATPPRGGPAQAAGDTGARGPAAPQAPASLAGSWALRTQDGTRPSPSLELAIDSVGAATFRVRVAFLMSGDVGIDPAQFESALGTVTQGGVVTLSVKMRGQADPVGQLSGTLVQDTIRLHQFRWVGEDQTPGRTRWLLVKQPS